MKTKNNTRKTTATRVNHVLRVLIERILEYCKAVKHTIGSPKMSGNFVHCKLERHRIVYIYNIYYIYYIYYYNKECQQIVTNLFTICQQVVFQVIGTSCKQLVATYKVVLTNLIPSRCNKNVTRQTKQVCNNIVI